MLTERKKYPAYLDELAELRASRAFARYASFVSFVPSRFTCLTNAPCLRALRRLFLRVKIVLGWICSPAKAFHFPWIIKGATNCVVLNKFFILK